MRYYNEKLKKQLISIVNTGDLEGEKVRTAFLNTQVIPFIENLMNNITEEDGLERLEVFDLNDVEGAGMCIRTVDGKLKFGINMQGLRNLFVKANSKGCLAKWNKDKLIGSEIRTVFHEERHVVQEKLLEEKDFAKLAPNAIVYAKEGLIVNSDYDWYRSRHGHFLQELEAHYAGFTGAKEFADISMPNSEFAKQVKAVSDYWLENLHMKEYFTGKNPYAYEISQKFDELMNATKTLNPKVFEEIFKDYPVLTLVYNKDGSKKSLKEILNTRNKILNENKAKLDTMIEVDGKKILLRYNIYNIFKTIISTDPGLQKEYEDSYLKKEIKREPKIGVEEDKTQDKKQSFERGL